MRAAGARALLLGVVAVLALTGCGSSAERSGGHQPPRDGAAGLQLSGTFAGRQVAVSDGAPQLSVGDACRLRTGSRAEVCFGSRDIDGRPVVVRFLNADAVRQGQRLEVADGGCRSVEACAEVTDVAVVEVQVGDDRQRATSGTIEMGQVLPGSRYVGTANLGFRSGRLSGRFDVVPRPEP